MKKRLHLMRIITMLSGMLLCPLMAEAVISLTSQSSTWDPILYLDDSDPTGDQQTGNAGNEADIVGDSSNAALYKLYDGSSDELAFRIRLGAEDNSNKGYDSATIVAFDIGNNGILDGYIGVELGAVGDVSGGKKQDVGIYQFTSIADTPNNTQSALSDRSDALVSYGSSNVDWSPVTDIDAGPVDIDGQGNPDHFLTFVVSFSDLTTSLGIEEDTTLGFVAITSQNLNQINNDYNGIDNNDPLFDGNAPWNNPDLPVTSLPYTPESEVPVPEASAYALLLGFVALAGVFARRPRRA